MPFSSLEWKAGRCIWVGGCSKKRRQEIVLAWHTELHTGMFIGHGGGRVNMVDVVQVN